MPSHRVERIAEAIREVVSTAVLFELADPRIKGVTVLRATVTGDLRHASVYVSIMGSDAEQRLALRGLQHAAGFLQSKVAARLQTRFTPTLTFKLDEGVKKSIAIARLIDEAVASDRHGPTPPDHEAVADAADDTRDASEDEEPDPGSASRS